MWHWLIFDVLIDTCGRSLEAASNAEMEEEEADGDAGKQVMLVSGLVRTLKYIYLSKQLKLSHYKLN